MKRILYLIAGVVILVNFSFAQQQASKPIVIKANYFDVSPPLRDMVQNPNAKVDMSWKDGVVKNRPYPKELMNYTEPDHFITDPKAQTYFGVYHTDTTIVNFDGVIGDGSLCPPDPAGDVGPNNYFDIVNCKYAIYDKNGVKLLGPFNNSQIFQGLPNNSNDGDGIVLYDEAADRWLFSQFSLPHGQTAPFFENVAISQTSDPTGSWYRYQFTFNDMPDYPKLSVWPDGYYLTCNRFASVSLNFLGTGAAALNRTQMLAGNPSASMVYFTLPANNQAWAVLPADCDSPFPPVGTPCYLAFTVPSKIVIYEFHVDWTNTSNSSYTQVAQIPVATYSIQSAGIPQKNTSVKLDPLQGARLMYRLQFRTFSDHWSMVANGTVNAGSNVAGIRWYELRKIGSNPWTVYQQSTYAPSDGNCRWMGSIAMDSSGNMALGYSISSANMFPSVRYTGRMHSDPLNQMTIAESGIINGGGSQTNTWSGSPSRWGDYSAMNIDPSATATFWYTQEYYATTSQAGWRARIGSFSFANILSIHATATPGTICIGSSSQLDVIPTGGSGTYTYSWTSVPAGFTSSIKNPVVNPTVDTKYVAHVSDGTQTRTDTTMVTVNQLPTANAGPDTSYCWWVPLFPVVGSAENYSHVKWTTAGDGHFNFDTVLIVLYYPGDNDRTSGSVTLSLKAYGIDPCADSTSDPLVVDLVCTGIAPPGNGNLTVSVQPNPAHDAFFINISGLKNDKVNLNIFDMQGRNVYREMMGLATGNLLKKIDASSFQKGTYFVKVQTDKGLKTEKLVVQ